MDMIDYLRSLFRCALKKRIVTDSRNTGQNEQFTVLVRPLSLSNDHFQKVLQPSLRSPWLF